MPDPGRHSTTTDAAVRRGVALIIDNDSALRMVLSRLATSLGLSAVEASSAEHAEQLAHVTDPDIVLLDLLLPGLSGEDWLIQYRQRSPSTPVIVVSGVNDPRRKASTLRNGADDFVCKPVHIPELEARMAALLRRPKDSQSRQLCGGALALEPGRADGCFEGCYLSLTTREFGILWSLSTETGRWIDCRKLSESVLGASHESHVHAMRVHVHHLRRKLSGLAHLLEIESERNKGYRLVDRGHRPADAPIA